MLTLHSPSRTRVSIRWMTRRDLGAVLAIENAVSDHPCCEEDFLRDTNEAAYAMEYCLDAVPVTKQEVAVDA
jgi:hypothetical protein